MMNVEEIRDGEDVLAIVIRSGRREEGMRFVTPKEFSLQVGYHRRGAGEKVEPHVHKSVEGMTRMPIQEFLLVESGRMRVHLYDLRREFNRSVDLGAGDAILLAGGHAIEFLEDVEMVEVKQGPYFEKYKDKESLKGDTE